MGKAVVVAVWSVSRRRRLVVKSLRWWKWGWWSVAVVAAEVMRSGGEGISK